MHYQLLNILRRFVSGKAGKWLTTLVIVLPLIFILSRYLGLSRNITIFVMFGALVLILLVWAVGSLRNVGNRKRSENFENDLGRHSQSAAASQEEIQQAVDDLSQQWGNAIRELKERRVPIYELPWFLLIGEPQSGKTTTLEKSGLEFPIGQEAISGTGGTRNCDWWFTEEAVILDTAGRFTFQEEAAPDKHEWDAFLGLLKKHRKECPINGVLVVIPATSLTEDTLDVQREKAMNIRRKLENLQKALDIRFPIFVLITKADRILGFSEFFGSLHPDQHGQIFGWSNPEEDKRWEPESLPGILDEITGRMHKLRLRLMHQARDSQQVDRFFVFPEELAALKTPLVTYLEVIFKASSRFQEPFLFRGFYLTSGLQEGRPIAVACRDLLRVQVGDARQVLEQLETVLTQRFAFFIRDFYSKKVFPEQGLVRQTLEAKEKDKKYRLASKVMLVVAVAVAFFALLPALAHLSQVLKPVNRDAADAKVCLEAAQTDTPCPVDETYELIYDIEETRENLRESRWLMRFLLQGGVKNEISHELLPTLQAGLFRLGVLRPLLESFEARNGPEIWQVEGMNYELFQDALAMRLRFDQYQLAGSEREALREQIRIEPLLRVLKLLPGVDQTLDGEEIDAWLADESFLGDISEIERIFQSVLSTEEQFDLMAVGSLPKPERAIAAFAHYWSIEQLARWESEFIEKYLRVYEESYRGILALDPEFKGADETLGEFARLSADLGRAYEEGSAFMSLRDGQGPATSEGEEELAEGETEEEGEDTRRRRRTRRSEPDPEEVAEVAESFSRDRPGKHVGEWEENCQQDYEALREIYNRVASKKEIQEHCKVRIPEDYRLLLADRGNFDYLYEETTEGSLGWSEGAGELQGPFVALHGLVKPEQVTSEATGFAERIAIKPGDDGKLEEIRDTYKKHREALWQPVQQLQAFESKDPDERFRAQSGRKQAELVAALGAGRMVLPPAEDYLKGMFDLDCSSCFSKNYANTFVKPANEFLGWSYSDMAPAGGVLEIREDLASINNAILRYLEAFIDRQGGGGGGGGLQRPYSAASADSWSRFAAGIRKWQLTASTSNRGPTSGLTLDMLEDFANSNSNLRPLIDKFRAANRPQTQVQVSPDLERAVQDYKNTVAVLEDDPLEAWRQLARGDDGASLEDFHAFSGNGRLRRNNFARWLVENVEEHGAKLLSDEIRPDFERDAARLWDFLDRCCRDRFPFISERELLHRRRAYEQGYEAARGGGDLWLPAAIDQRTLNSTLKIELPTATREDLDQIFFAGGDSDRLFEDYVLDPMLAVDREGNPITSVDFLSPQRERFLALRQWQMFLYGNADDRRASGRTLADDQTFILRILEGKQTGDRIYLGERVGRITLFDRGSVIRPSTDARTGRKLEIPVRFDEAPLFITGTNEDEGSGWNGRLEIRGGPLKLLYFILLSREEVRADRQVWTVRVEIPDFGQPRNRLEGVFELEFDRPVPGVVFDSSLSTGRGDR